MYDIFFEWGCTYYIQWDEDPSDSSSLGVNMNIVHMMSLSNNMGFKMVEMTVGIQHCEKWCNEHN